MKFDDGVFFLCTEIATFHIRSEVINPSQTTTLATPQQSFIACIDRIRTRRLEKLKKEAFKDHRHTSLLWERSPILMTILVNERDEFQVFIMAPWSSLHFGFVTTWCSSFAHILSLLSHRHTLLRFPLTKSNCFYVYLYMRSGVCDPDIEKHVINHRH